MWCSLFRLVISCVLTLALLVIWRTANVNAATSPVVTVLQPAAQGLRAPVRMALDAEGNSYVADTRSGGIMKFNTYGELIRIIPTTSVPQAIAFAQDGKMLVSEGTFVAILDAAGNEVGRLSAQFKFADGIAIDDVTGFIYVVDSLASQVLVFTATGSYVKSIGSFGKANGQFAMPTGIAFDKVLRQIAVVDSLNYRIQFFSLEGLFIKKIGVPGTGPMKFTSPQGIAFEYSKDPIPVLKRMYVVDSFQGNVQVIDPAGVGTPLYLAGTNPLNNYIGSYGDANGQLSVPTDVVFDGQNSRLLVVNGFGNITAFGIDGGTNPVNTVPPSLAINPVLANVFTPDITISGTLDANATLTIATSTTAIAAPVVFTSSNTWKCDITGLVGGDNVITATATNAAGKSTIQSVTVRYILPAPVISLSPGLGNITSNSSFTLSGTVDEGSTVTVSNASTSTANEAMVTGTTWTYTTVLTEGSNHFTITAQKPMSDKGFASADITLDSIAPQLTVSALANGSYTSAQVQNITGTVSDAGLITVLVNDQPAIVNNGTFSAVVTLEAGVNLISVIAQDPAGNVNADTRTINFDSTQPVISVAAPMDNSMTNSSLVTITGTVDKTSTVSVSGVPAVMNGNEWTADVSLQAGLNTIEITATDLYGNSSTVKRSIVQDSVQPVLAISSPSQDIATNNPIIVISGAVSDSSDSSLVYSLNGLTAAVPITAGAFTFNLDLTIEGVYPVLLTVSDAAGNATSAIRNIIYDITPPRLSLDVFKGAHPTLLTGKVEPGAAVVVKENGVSIGKVTIDSAKGTWQANLANIAYKPKLLSIQATDVAGNSTKRMLSEAGADNVATKTK